LALTSPTGGGRSVGIVRVRTKATEFVCLFEVPSGETLFERSLRKFRVGSRAAIVSMEQRQNFEPNKIGNVRII